MNSGFKKLTVTDPNKLKTFIEGVTGSIVAILNVSIYFGYLPLFTLQPLKPPFFIRVENNVFFTVFNA